MRRFGTPISGNTRRTGYLQPDVRGAILGMLSAGKSQRAVARAIGVSHSTVRRTAQRWNTHGINDSLPKKGRPQIFTPAEKRYIWKLVRRNPRIAWKALRQELGGRACKNTLRRVLQEFQLKKWKCQKRIPLTKENALERLYDARDFLAEKEEFVRVYAFDVKT